MSQHDLYLLAVAVLVILAAVFAIARLRMHPFPALVIAALALGLLAGAPADQVLKSFRVGFGDTLGALVPGMKADAILVDLDEILDDPWWSGDLDVAEMFVHRAKGHHVDTVVVGGKVVIENRAFKTIDVPALWAEVRKVASRGLPPAQVEFAALMHEVKPYAQAWYARWQKPFGAPYYRVNARD